MLETSTARRLKKPVKAPSSQQHRITFTLLHAARNLTPAEIAKAGGPSKTTLYAWRKKPVINAKIFTLQALADVLNLELTVTPKKGKPPNV